jgi:hypothetical protein
MTNEQFTPITIKGEILPDETHREMVITSLNPATGTICVLCGQEKTAGETSCAPCAHRCPDPDCRGYQAKAPSYPCCSGCNYYFLNDLIPKHRRAGHPPVYVYEMQGTRGQRKVGMTWRLAKRPLERNAKYCWIGGPFPEPFAAWQAEYSYKAMRNSRSEDLRRLAREVSSQTLSHRISATAMVADEVIIRVSRAADLGGLNRHQVVPVARYEVLGPQDDQWRLYQDQQEVVIEDVLEAAQGRWLARAVTQTGATSPVTELVIPRI